MSSGLFHALRVGVVAVVAAVLAFAAGRAAALPDGPVIPPDWVEAPPAERMIFNFIDPAAGEGWYAVNDTVMGGKSSSRLEMADGYAVFTGEVSLKNFGGFASVRAPMPKGDLSAHDGLAVRVRGDGKKYKLFVKTNKPDDGLRYQANIDPGQGQWRTIRVPFSELKPYWRGWRLHVWPGVNVGKIQKLGFMIADGQDGPFRLEIQWVKAYSED